MAQQDEAKPETEVAARDGGLRARRLVSWPLAPLNRAPASRVALAPTARQAAGEDGEASEKRSRSRLIGWSLVVIVALPAFLTGIYLFGFASDQYVAEAQFAVRMVGAEERRQDQAIPSLLTMSGLPSSQDADIVADYIHSRAIVDDVSKHVDLVGMFHRPEADILAKLEDRPPVEALTSYWRRMVSVDIENTSGIVTLQTRAFRREDALALAQAVLQSSQGLVETLSDRVRTDSVKHAEDEFHRAETRVHAALGALQNFRNAQGLIDPIKSADANGKLLLQLMGDKIQLESQLFVSQRTTGLDAPGIAPMRARLDSINVQIGRLQEQMAGGTGATSNLAALISRYEDLDLNRQFAERLYTLTQEGLARARLLADRRGVYLAVFVPPSLPEQYSYPLRWSSFLLVTASAFLTWCCGATIWASVLDHRL
jgi:capsular polysaccharide transport system permease protein